MKGLPGKRIVPYVAAGLLVVVIGGYSFLSSGRDVDPEVVWSSSESVTQAGGPPGDAAGVAATPGGEPAGTALGDGSSAPLGVTSTSERPACFVQVAGAVARPGVYEVPSGARVFQVLLMAGGMTAEADQEAVPLAAQVADGSCIRVPRVGETLTGSVVLTTPSGAMSQPGSAGAGPISLSAAGEAELDTLPGVGPKTAQQIIAYRDEHGPFTSVEQLEEVPGIGPATVERLRNLVVP